MKRLYALLGIFSFLVATYFIAVGQTRTFAALELAQTWIARQTFNSGADITDIGTYEVRGLRAFNNTVTPNTQFDLSADAVQYRNSNNSVIVTHNPATVTNDILLSGPAQNGRDQAAAFADLSWIHFYFIRCGATHASISSLVAPPSGPTLPGGCTHWAYNGAVRLNAVQTLVKTRFYGNFAWLEVDHLGITRVLSGGTATVFTPISLATLVPPNSTMASLRFEADANTATIGQVVDAFIRPTGSSLTTGVRAVRGEVLTAGQDSLVHNTMNVMLNSAQSFDYRLTTAVAIGVSIDVIGYYMPNGGV